MRAVIHLARQTNGPTQAARIARTLDLPANYLSKILHSLARAGVLESERGPRGGFRLARPAGQLTLSEVIAPFDGSLDRRNCLLGRDSCSDETACLVHGRWKQVSEAVARFFGQTTVGDLVEGGVPPL